MNKETKVLKNLFTNETCILLVTAENINEITLELKEVLEENNILIKIVNKDNFNQIIGI